ncbi:hypothetical protein SAMN05216360_117100 [Methylobacterium phyllostachyos]|uniref:Cell wall anchor protein n=2 Tax=Methylobacterium phyllostachyos TaxID=582672 RepID=A0A1H0I0N3_9HYPH|nr:hypothetical protein SAMN05216360_117100 [Methylobacterium phyllostachyos]
MSVNAVSGTSLRQDLVSALRQARAASAQSIDASAFATSSQDTGATQGTSSSTQTTGTASTPAMSSDLMASLLQLQSDFSQMGLQTGVTSGTDSDDASNGMDAPGSASQATTGAAPVHHHHGHHARPPESDASSNAQVGQSATTTDATSASSTTTVGSAAGSDRGDGLQSLFQQVTKAVAAYATGGPLGIAAAALTTSTKA